MALTKVTGQVIKNTTDVTVGVLTVTNTLAVGGTVSIGGTLTYEDVTNVDAVGLITARNGIVVGSGITLSKDGDIFATGITTVSGNVKVGTGITLSPDGDGFFTGVITATSYSGIDLSDVTGATGDFSIADKIVHTGDTNTAIRFPSADTVTVEVAGTERLRIDDSDGVIAQHTTAANLRIQNSTAASSQVAQLDMAPAGSISGVQLKCTSEEDFSTGANRTAYFTVHNRKDGAFYERLRIDSSGKIGIGGAPSAWQAATTTKALQIGNACLFNYNDTYYHMGQNFYYDGSNYKFINDGYGTRFVQNAGTFAFFVSDASGSAGGNVNFLQKITIDTAGRLLIGTTTEGEGTADNLTIADSGNCGVTIRSGTTSEGNIFFSDGTSGADEYRGTIQYNHSSNYMQFATNGSERMRIMSDGRVSIGGMAPDTGVNLHIESSGEANFLLEGSASTVGGYLMLKNKDNTANSSMSIQFLDASGQGVSEINGVAMSDANNQGYLSFKTRPNGGSMTERYRISDIGVQEYTQQSNVRTFNFAFSGGVGGSTTTQAIATLTNTSSSTMAVAHIYYVSNYGIANDYLYAGAWVCSTRRSNSNSSWDAESNQTANGGDGSAGPVVIGWLNGELQFTCTAFMGYTIHVSLTVYNATTTINAL